VEDDDSLSTEQTGDILDDQSGVEDGRKRGRWRESIECCGNDVEHQEDQEDEDSQWDRKTWSVYCENDS
jgi:hypothetical protein